MTAPLLRMARWACHAALRALTVAALAALGAVAGGVLAGCGGGADTDPPDPAVCYVDGKPMPREVCR